MRRLDPIICTDNCQLVQNANQLDTNGDGFGNVCDADLSNDCAVNFVDLGMMKSVFFTADADADLNGDGTVNFIDLGIMNSGFFQAPGPSGVLNECDPVPVVINGDFTRRIPTGAVELSLSQRQS